jgi:hypothetical protein
MELALSGYAPAASASRVVAATKPKGAKGTGKAKKPKAAAAGPATAGGHVPPGTLVHFVDGGFIGAAAAGGGKTVAAKTSKKAAVKVKHPPPAVPKPAKPPHALGFTAMGPGRAVGISCNGKEILAEIEFAMSLSLGDKCIRVDGHVVHSYKSGDRIAVGGLTAQGIMNLV